MKSAVQKNNNSAFTIVELLIVIVIIAVLAAITVVAYNGIQDRARASAASSALSNAVKKIKYWQAEQDSTLAPTSLATAGVSDGGGVSYQYSFGQPTTADYCITATVGPKSYKVSTSNTTAILGGCAGHGVGGVGAITNIVTNPSFETNSTGWNGVSATVSRVTTGAVSGTYALAVTPGVAVDSFARYGSTSALATGITPGSTYTVSGTVSTPVAQTGTIDSRARGITVYSWTGASAATSVQSSRAPNTAGSSTRISATFTVPSGSTGLEIRFYNGASNTATNIVYWDGIMLTSGSTNYNFADGDSADWIWNTDNTSTGPPV